MSPLRQLLLSILCFLSFCLSACDRTDYSSVLSQSGLSRFYFGSETNCDLSLDIDAEMESTSLSAILPHGTDLSSLVSSYEISGYALFVDGIRQYNGESTQDFTTSQTYSLYSLDGQFTDFTITAVESQSYFETFCYTTTDNIALKNDCSASIGGNGIWFYLSHAYSLAKLTPNFTSHLDGTVTYNGAVIASSESSYDFRSSLVFRVYEAGESEDPEFMDYQISAYRLTGLLFSGLANSLETDYDAYLEDDTITVELPYDTDLTHLVPTYTFLGDTLTFDGEEVTSGSGSHDFSGPVEVTVATNSGLSHTYTVRIKVTETPQNPVNDPLYPDGSGSENGDPVAVTGVSLNSTAAQVLPGDTLQLVATVVPSYAADTSVTWTSSNTATATVSSSGLVTGVSAGNATITATTTDGGYCASCTVTVSGVTLNTTSAEVNPGETLQLLASVVPSDTSVTWTSSDTAVATVSAAGLVTGVGTGNTVITATTDDGKSSASCTVNGYYYLIYHNENGLISGSVPDPVGYYSGDSITIDSPVGLTGEVCITTDGGNTITKQLYWNTQSDGGGTTYRAVETGYTLTDNLDLYVCQQDPVAGSPVGMVGPAGGYVFSFDGTTYYEVAPEPQAHCISGYSTAQWLSTNALIGGTGTAIGDGKTNTAIILAYAAANGLSAPAAQLCADYSVTRNGVTYDDWFLPSRYELTAYLDMYASFDTIFIWWDFWSSSEYDDNSAYIYYYSSTAGSVNKTSNSDYSKTSQRGCRAVRSFE